MIKPLTSLRFIFAILVFGHHAWFMANGEYSAVDALYQGLFKEGFIGVSFFFVLSGFIMSYSYKEKLEADKMSFTSYWIARFARIYPLHLLMLLLAIPLSFNTDPISWINKLLLQLMLAQSFIPSDGYYLTFNAVSWSLSDEMFFYLCFPLLVLLFTNRRFRFWIPLAYVVAVPVGLLLTREVLHHAIFYVNPLIRMGDFIAGMLLYRLYEHRKNKEYLNNKAFASLAEVFTIGLLALCIAFRQHIPIGFRYSLYYLLPMCLLIYVFAYSRGFISAFLSKKWMVLLGDLSFSFYLVHVLVLRYYILLQSHIPALPLGVWTAIALFFVTLGLAFLAHRYYELPVNKYIREAYSSRRIFNLTARMRKELKKASSR